MTATQAAIRAHSKVLHALDQLGAERAAPGIVVELEATLDLIYSQILTEVDQLTDVTTHLFSGPSMLIRPILCLLSAAAGEGPLRWPESARTMAAVTEITHVATLYHDDVMDEAATRRGLPSANFRFGNNYAVLAGDLLISRALEMSTTVGLEQCRLMTRTLRRLCQGHALEMRDQYLTERTVSDYLLSIDGKSAELFAAACTAGAMEANFTADDVRRLAAFGRSFGLALQIVEDIRDLSPSRGQPGRPTMKTIRVGVYTLPVVEAMRRDPELKRVLQACAEGTLDIVGELDTIRARIIATGAIEHAKSVAVRHISDAMAALAAVSSRSKPVGILQAMARAVGPR